MTTFLGKDIAEGARGILYICWYNHEHRTMEVVREIQFSNPFDALQAYSNTPNPESQIASGSTTEEFVKNLAQLHDNLHNPEWVAGLQDYL